MRLKTVVLRNFRAYKDEIRIPIDDFTAFIGKNDVGKSTVLEALEIFFNNVLIKMESTDKNVYSQERFATIGCVFSDFPERLILDANSETSLEQEYLLNSDGDLEILKVYDCSLKSPKEAIYAVCFHPSADQVSDLMKLKNSDLKKRSKDFGLDLTNIDQRSNPDLREAIRKEVADLKLIEQQIALNEDNGKAIWESISKYLPQYALFKADRTSKDDDSEVQDPIKFAVTEALKAVEPELEKIKTIVQDQVMTVAHNTLSKLREMDPALANELNPHPKGEPKWAGLFNMSLTSDDQIPINKRGSGVRRLILLNFFRAEAERKQTINNAPGIIYAVEEPETAQHPNNQKMLLRSLITLSTMDNCQVIITTHVPGLAGLIDIKNLRFIDIDLNGTRSIFKGEDKVYKQIATQLGVIPDKRVRLFICVEGPNDVQFLKHLSRILRTKNSDLPDLENDPRIAMFHLGGSTLKDWVQNHYLSGLGIPELHIYDRDDGPQPKYIKEVERVNSRRDGSKAFYTSKREMENYIHPYAIAKEFEFQVTFSDDDDVPELVAKTLYENNASTTWNEISDKKKSDKVSNAKKRLNNRAASYMTYEHILEIDPNHDIESWFAAMSAILNIQETQRMVAPTTEQQ